MPFLWTASSWCRRRGKANASRPAPQRSQPGTLGMRLRSPRHGWLIDGSVECLELPFLSAGDQKWIMGRGMCEWLGWPLPQ
jgi:hypothetical protein